MTGLLAAAQQAGAVRDDVDTADVKVLVTGCIARDDDGVSQQRMIEIVRDGLQPRRA